MATSRALYALLMLALLSVGQCKVKPLSAGDQAKFDKVKAFMVSQYKHDPKERPMAFKVKSGYNDDGFRGLFATEDIVKGDVILTIPAGATLNLGGDASDEMETTVRLMAEMKSPCSRFKPYFDYLPVKGEVWNWCNMPLAYTTMLQNNYWEFMVNHYHHRVKDIVHGGDSHSAVITLEEAVGKHSITPEELGHVCALSSTRNVDMSPRKTTIMMPVMDLANHRRPCPVTLGAWNHLGDWDTDVHMVATEDIKKDDELCYTYGDHQDDHFMLYYGFMPQLAPGQDSNGLFFVDHHKFKWEGKADGEEEAWPQADGPDVSDLEGATIDEAQTERARLKQLLVSLDEHSKVNPNPKPIKGSEWLHGQLVEYQRRRRAAIVTELRKLEAIIANAKEL